MDNAINDCRDLDNQAMICVKIVDNISSMIKYLNTASAAVDIGHVKRILVTSVCGETFSNAAIKR